MSISDAAWLSIVGCEWKDKCYCLKHKVKCYTDRDHCEIDDISDLIIENEQMGAI